jgi:hypothetical protein
MSTTPRTNAAKVQGADAYSHCYYVHASTASDLERELAETIESEANWKLTAKHHGERAGDLERENTELRKNSKRCLNEHFRLLDENAELRADKARLREALDRIVALGARMPEDAEEVCIAKAAIDAAMEESK